jgi:hypothetical protein
MNKLFFVLALLSVPAFAGVEAGRGLPAGEDQIAVIEKVYKSPFGDLEFTRTGESHSVLLRNVRGGLLEMTRINGAMECDEWFISDKSEEIPRGCEFQFYSLDEGTMMNVRSDEMEESNLFQAVSGSVRERGKNVAL